MTRPGGAPVSGETMVALSKTADACGGDAGLRAQVRGLE